ncbi:hypothetical protein GCM10007972_19940 [Iodidimonas muriae]|uniref:HPt domain-containing protein n=2 Tax=Iodidimonas muriae TaxID=261467 RepID=A0ABQ2LEE4_9PROT|nr:hypothetical protein JCM17843_12680 [Kordiimonadales bacterium JCM 17843]GGO13594.1 hypothetical protein GCM10007972_19940 [Iodidimonas muriae]
MKVRLSSNQRFGVYLEIDPMPHHPSPIDHTHLDNFTGGDKALQDEVIDIFIKNTPDYFAALETSSPQDWRTALHRLKGAARSIGAKPFALLAQKAEKAEPKDYEAHRCALREEFARLKATITR